MSLKPVVLPKRFWPLYSGKRSFEVKWLLWLFTMVILDQKWVLWSHIGHWVSKWVLYLIFIQLYYLNDLYNAVCCCVY